MCNIRTSKKVMLTVKIENKDCQMLYDPGAAHSVIGKKVWKNLGKPKLQPTNNLVAYTDIEIKTLGTTKVQVTAYGRTLTLPIYVVEQDDTPLFGLDWCIAFKTPLPEGARICNIQYQKNNDKQIVSIEKVEKQLTKILEQHKELFDGSIGTIRGHTARIHISSDVTPKTFRPRPVPLALQKNVSKEIERLVKEDVLEPGTKNEKYFVRFRSERKRKISFPFFSFTPKKYRFRFREPK
ncbi:uncharacterized protein [Onthophagus taurus]|uniref:uncharacterized protein n=1 Tax=Onthophagus taurus TaxID=166361 RepID=UPI0039BEC443